jgi:peptide/nickel transport system substrate-binding protein
MSDHERLTILQARVALGDPHVCSDARDRLNILAAIYEPLVARGAGGEFAPCLAHTWSLDPDARTWRFVLREEVRFHNGATLHAEDVVASLARVCDPDLGGELGTQGVYRSYLGGAEIAALDARTVRIVTDRPMADLLDLLAEMPIVPRSALAGLPEQAVGSGPYRVEAVAGGRIEMAAFDDYWGGKPTSSRLTWMQETDAAARLAAVESGAADLGVAVPGAAASASKMGVTAPGYLCVIVMCAADRGPCADRRVRQALNYAADVPALIAALRGGAAVPASGPLTMLHAGYDPACAPYPHDPALARALLAEAGYPVGVALTIDVPATLPDEAPALAAMLREQYAAAGIDLTVRIHHDRPAYADMVRAKQYGDLCCFDSSPFSTYRVLREKIHSGVRGPWWQGYANPEVDTLIDGAAATADDARRHAIYRQAYRIIHDDAPWVFLYNPDLAWAVGSRLAGWRPAADGIVRFVSPS